MGRAAALILALAVGGLVAFQPPANSQLAHHAGDLGAAFVSLLISTLIVTVLLLVFGDPGRLSGGWGAFKPEWVIGGIAGAAIVAVSLIAVRTLGAGGVTAALVAGQLTASVVIDRLGVLGVREVPIGWTRVVGVALVIGGALLVTRP
jgi:transporter family-2 protein